MGPGYVGPYVIFNSLLYNFLIIYLKFSIIKKTDKLSFLQTPPGLASVSISLQISRVHCELCTCYR